MAKRKKRTVTRDSKGRFVKGGRSKVKGRRRLSKRTSRRITSFIKRTPKRRGRRVVSLRRGQVALVNRKRRYARNDPGRRRHYRHNPGLFSGLGFNMETLKTVGLTAGGFLGTPFVEGFVVNYLPTSISGNKFARYAVRIGAAIGLGFLIGKAMGKDAGKKVAIGGLAYVGIGLIKDFMPSLAPGTGAYLRSQPLLGTYQRTAVGSYITSSGPSRLNPANRY